jgi:hypothetical protein
MPEKEDQGNPNRSRAQILSLLMPCRSSAISEDRHARSASASAINAPDIVGRSIRCSATKRRRPSTDGSIRHQHPTPKAEAFRDSHPDFQTRFCLPQPPMIRRYPSCSTTLSPQKDRVPEIGAICFGFQAPCKDFSGLSRFDHALFVSEYL